MRISSVDYYPFSLYQLASLLTHTKIKKVDIITKFTGFNTWIYYLWVDSSSSLIEAYENKGYAIELDDDGDICIKLL